VTEALQAAEPQNALASLQSLMATLIEKGGDAAGIAAALKDLVGLYREEQDRAAAREFAADFAEFQTECPAIPRTTSSNKSATQQGTSSSFEFKYASIDEVADGVRPHLHKRGFSYTWDVVVSDKNIVTATCTLRHRNGHSISASFACPVDASAHMNPMQKVASARGYACRYALVQVLGLTTTEVDTDVRPENVEKITSNQMDNLHARLSDTKADFGKFLSYVGASSLGEITQAQYRRGLAALEQRALAQRKVKASE